MCVVSLSSHLRLSSVSAVFDFNASLNGVAPVFPMLFTDDFKEKRVDYGLMAFVCCFFVFTSQIELSECCV